MLEQLGIAKDLERRRLAHPQAAYVAPLDRVGAEAPVEDVPLPITLNVLHATADALVGKMPTSTPVCRAPEPFVPRTTSRDITVQNVMAVFCEVYTELTGAAYTIGDLKGARRWRDVAWPRQVCMMLVRNLCGLSTPPVGKHFGDRDHTTVMHALKRAPDHMQERPVLKAAYDQVVAFFAEGTKTGAGL